MRHYGNIHIIKYAHSRHHDLRSVRLLGRRAKKMYLGAVFVGKPSEHDSRADGHHRDKVVTAGMPDTRQSVILRKYGYLRTRLSASVYRLICSIHIVVFFGQLKTVFSKQLELPCYGLEFVSSELRIFVNIDRKLP